MKDKIYRISHFIVRMPSKQVKGTLRLSKHWNAWYRPQTGFCIWHLKSKHFVKLTSLSKHYKCSTVGLCETPREHETFEGRKNGNLLCIYLIYQNLFSNICVILTQHSTFLCAIKVNNLLGGRPLVSPSVQIALFLKIRYKFPKFLNQYQAYLYNCTYLNAFLICDFKYSYTKFKSFDIFLKILCNFWLVVCSRTPRGKC